MATLKQGILGGFSGKAGTVIGYTRKGVAYIRGLMTSFTNPNTPAQAEQRAKFSLVMQFLRPLVALLRISWRDVASTRSGFNLAVSYTMEHAIKGIYPLLEIDYTKVRISEGNLPGAQNAQAASVVANTIDFTWEDNTWDFGARSDDKVILVAYCPFLKKSVSLIGASRLTEAQTMVLPDLFSGEEVQTFIGFCNQDKTEFSMGEYLKSVVVA